MQKRRQYVQGHRDWNGVATSQELLIAIRRCKRQQIFPSSFRGYSPGNTWILDFWSTKIVREQNFILSHPGFGTLLQQSQE